MPTFDVWDIVKVPFPYTNRPIEQRRPALVLVAIEPVGSPALLWVAMITSAANRSWPDDITISDDRSAGLTAPSVIRLAKIATIDQAAALPLGCLAKHDRLKVTRLLATYLATALSTG